MELVWEPRKEALAKISKVEKEPEMTEFESAFLCGLIKENRPHKILEIGIAAGGTTAIILQCLYDLKMFDCELISADLNEKFYRGGDRKTGFLAQEIKPHVNGINHRFFLGHVIAETIEEIGGDIDLVVLDTVHFLPGEVLDFPVVLPFLSENAIVVLHDIAYHHIWKKDGISNQVLLDAITGEKIVPMDLDKAQTTAMPNIGAVRINDDTKKYIDAVFYSLTLPWHYIPRDTQLNIYRDFYVRYYDENIIKLFDTAVQLNKVLLSKTKKESDTLRHELEKQKKRADTLQYALDCVHNSVSFRIGRSITCLPRKLRDLYAGDGKARSDK